MWTTPALSLAGDCGEVMASRAKSCPLRIDKFLDTYRALGQFRDFLALHLSHIESLIFFATDGFIHALFQDPSLRVPAPMLTSLTLKGRVNRAKPDGDFHEDFIDVPEIFEDAHAPEFLTSDLFAGNASQLTELKLLALPYPDIIPFFANLTHLSIISPMSNDRMPTIRLARLIAILEATPRLKKLKLEMANCWPEDDNPPTPGSFNPVNYPTLRHSYSGTAMSHVLSSSH